jgi:hypothetical protein
VVRRYDRREDESAHDIVDEGEVLLLTAAHTSKGAPVNAVPYHWPKKPNFASTMRNRGP